MSVGNANKRVAVIARGRGVEAEQGKGRRERRELDTHGLYNLGRIMRRRTYMKYRKQAQLVMRAKKAELPGLGLVEKAVIYLFVSRASQQAIGSL